MRALESSNTVNVEQWLTKMARSRPKKGQQQQKAKGVWRETVPPFFSPPPSQNKQTGGDGLGEGDDSGGRDKSSREYAKEEGDNCYGGKMEQKLEQGINAHRVQAESHVSSDTLRTDKENQVSTSFRTYIDENQVGGEADTTSHMSLRGQCDSQYLSLSLLCKVEAKDY